MSIAENIVLVGFMGTGKSAIAREISKKLNFHHIETDEMIEKREGMKISEIFEKKGEPYFRKLEHKMLKEICQTATEKAVISTGGGMPVSDLNRDLLKSLGYVVWLKTTKEETFKRVSNDDNRPLLSGGEVEFKILTLMEERDPIYQEVSQFKIDTEGLSISEISGGIIDSASYFFSKHEV